MSRFGQLIIVVLCCSAVMLLCRPGSLMREQGAKPRHPVVMIPGVYLLLDAVLRCVQMLIVVVQA